MQTVAPSNVNDGVGPPKSSIINQMVDHQSLQPVRLGNYRGSPPNVGSDIPFPTLTVRWGGGEGRALLTTTGYRARKGGRPPQ